MSAEHLSEILASIAILFFLADLLAQTIKINIAKSAKEVSLRGVLIRTIGTIFFVFRFAVTGDTVLLIGQVIFLALIIYYASRVAKYRKR
jgi:uncharacterized protein with PQ loop repeat